MSDLVKDINSLRYYHTSTDTLKDKDLLKNQVFSKYEERVSTLLSIPLVF